MHEQCLELQGQNEPYQFLYLFLSFFFFPFSNKEGLNSYLRILMEINWMLSLGQDNGAMFYSFYLFCFFGLEKKNLYGVLESISAVYQDVMICLFTS